MKIIKKLQVVVETTEYIKQAETCMDKKSRDDFISYIAHHPLEGGSNYWDWWCKKDTLDS